MKRLNVAMLSLTVASNDTTEKSVKISTDGSPVMRIPQELLSAIINYVPKTQWPSLELVNRSFRDSVYSSWQSMKEFDIGKDVLDIRQSVKGVRLSDFLPSILAKLVLRSPMLQSIIGFPEIHCNSDEARSDILHIICQFTNLKRIDFASSGFKSLELVEFLTSSSSRDRLMEFKSSSYKQSGDWGNHDWPEIFIARENSASQASRLKLEKLSLKHDYLIREGVFLDPVIIDVIDPSSLTVLVLDKIALPSDYLLSLITNSSQLQQLQFSFMGTCRCWKTPCVHVTSSKQILEAIPEMEILNSLKIGMTNPLTNMDTNILNIEADLPVLIDRLGRRGRLMEFGLLHYYYCSDQVIEEISHHLTGLKSLQLDTKNCRSTTLVDMIKKMVNLDKFAISWPNSEVLTAVTSHLPNLRSLHLDWPNDIDLGILTSMEHLEELSIDGDAEHKTIKWESATAFGHNLQSLELRNCNEEVVATFLKQVPGLRRLVLFGELPEKDKVLRMIPMACPRLREFQLLPSVGFFDEDMKDGVQAIIDGCLELENLRC